MTDDFHDDDGLGSGSVSVHDPWLHFAITSQGELATSEPEDVLGEPHASWGSESDEPLRSRAIPANWATGAGTDLNAASRLAADLFRRRRIGETTSLSESALGTFATGNESLAGLLSCRDSGGSPGSAPSGRERILRLPEVGDTLFGFHLRYPLGRGAFARVFLAEQSDLAGRPVVLKISAIEGTEPQTMAQLQHTNIVPIYSAHEDPRAGLRAVCMPYFGGASLSSILQQCWSRGSAPLRGAEFVTALEAVQSPPPLDFKNGVKIDLGFVPVAASQPGDEIDQAEDPPPSEGCTPLSRLGKLSFIQASAWIVAEIADGLQHAHQRGIFHRDIKPSNILISAEGEPLLLDFNLAQDQDIDPALAILGGTVAYMAPEHLRALAGRSAALIRHVDQRSDIYSLGMVLAEMLTGQNPFDQSASYSALPLQVEALAVERSKSCPSVRQRRPEVPWGLESIVRKCLAPEPNARYQQADQLAEDLRRFLDDRPLKYAPELSRAEQLQKFARRHPRLTSSGSIAAAALVALFAVGWALAEFRGLLGASQARDRLRAHDEGTTQALCRIITVLDLERQDYFRQGEEVCEKTLGLYTMPDGMRWKDQPDLPYLSPEERLRLSEDRRELLALLAGTRIRLAPHDKSVRQQALALLDQAEAIEGLAPSRALWLQRCYILESLGQRARAAAARRTAEQIPATTARDHYELATVYAREGNRKDLHRAVQELDASLRINPRHYWSVFQRGICHLELGERLLAAADFGQCIGLWPESPWGYFNRGCMLELDRRNAEALADYSAALRLDPRFASAAINRGWVLLKMKKCAAALADFDRAQKLGRREGMLDAGRGIALEGLKQHALADAAFAAAFARVKPRPDPARERLCWLYGSAVADRLPKKARDAFNEILLKNPRHPEALYGCAMLAVTAGRFDDAIATFSRAVESNPGFNEARRARAVLLARNHDWEHAGLDINWCLEREPTSGETLYAAACVAAIGARAAPNTRALNQAFDFLIRAFDRDIPTARAAVDPDLSGIRKDPRFETLLARGAASQHREAHDHAVP